MQPESKSGSLLELFSPQPSPPGHHLSLASLLGLVPEENPKQVLSDLKRTVSEGFWYQMKLGLELMKRAESLSKSVSRLEKRFESLEKQVQSYRPPYPEKPILSVREAAEYLRVDPRWIYRHAKELPFVFKNGRVVRVSRKRLEEYIERQLTRGGDGCTKELRKN
jgi:excisionase family DNA binding protein